MVKNKNKNKKQVRISSNAIAYISAITIVLGLFLLSYNFVNKRRILAHDYINEKINMDVEVRNVESSEEDTEPEVEDDTETNLDYYIGYLEIPKINFNRGFYNVDSAQNTVDSNIQVIRGSSMPTKSGGNLIIAGHSGTGWQAFFNDLYQLQIGDVAIVTYKDHRYTYTLKNIYTEPKTGQITVKRDKTKTTLTLITCTNNSNTTQSVYILELSGKE